MTVPSIAQTSNLRCSARTVCPLATCIALARELATERCETVHADGQSAGEEEPVPRLEAIVINCREPATLASFHAELLGLAISPEDAAAIMAGTLGKDESVLLGAETASMCG